MSTTQYMLLVLPTPGTTNDFTGEQEEVAAFQTIDVHDHSIGKGTYVTPAGLLINADLGFGSNNATALRSVRFSNNSLALSLSSDIGCAFVAGGDLYYRNVNGQTVQITSGGSIVAGAQGNITGLAVPAAVNYNSSSGTYSFVSNASRAALIDAGPLIIRDTALSALGITVQSPAGLASAYSITLPSALPASAGLLQISTGGALSSFGTVSGTTLGVTGNVTAAAAIVGSTSGPASAVAPYLALQNGSGQANLYMQDGRGSAGNKLGRIIYDAGVALSSAGWAFQNVDDNGAFVSNGLTIFRNGLLQLSTQGTQVQPSSIYTAVSFNPTWFSTAGLSYWKDASGIVRAKGPAQTLGSPPSNPVFTFPAGFRPLATRLFPCWSTVLSTFVNVQVASNGQVSVSTINGSDTYYLDSIAFAAEA